MKAGDTMRIKILEHSWECENDRSQLGALFRKIEHLLEENAVHIGKMVVDGREIFEEYREYIENRVDAVKLIEIETVTLQQYADELILEIRNYLNRALPEIPSLTTEFYQGGSKEAWSRLNELLEGLQYVLQYMNIVYEQRQIQYDNLEIFGAGSQMISSSVSELMEAVQEQNTTMIADILLYEILEGLSTFKEEMQNTIDNEVVPHDLN